MSTITNGSMKLIKSDITDIIHSTIGSDLPNNFDKIDKTVDEVNTRINNILTTPVDGVSAQEIIDARGDSPTLGTRLNSMQTQTDSLQEEVDSLSTTGIPKLVSFDYDITATVDGQTVFTIPYEHLSLDTDTVEVFVNGIAVPDNYYIITEPVEVDSAITLGFVTLTEVKPLGTIVKVRILKNVPNGDEGSVDGEVITVDSIPLNRINSGELNDFMTDTLSEINASLNALANPNLLINGDFQVWQRGTFFGGISSNYTYAADRWCYDIEGEDKGDVHKYEDSGLTFKLLSQKRMWLTQHLELSKELIYSIRQNGYLTASFDVYSHVNLNPKIRLYTGTYDNLMSVVQEKSYNCNSNTKRVSITFEVDESMLNGKETLSLDIFRLDDSNKIDVDDNKFVVIRNVKLELGNIATPFYPRSYGEELALCQRYYEVSDEDEPIVGYCNSTESMGVWKYKVPKRIRPTINVSHYVYGEGRLWVNSSDGISTNAKCSPYMIDLNHCRVKLDEDSEKQSLLNKGITLCGKFIADAEIY